jgi:AcrR family transcriptional regulator
MIAANATVLTLQPGAPAVELAPHADGHADKQTQILDGAALVFAQDGYEGASMSRIAAEAGVSKGTLYNYFSCKAELFAAYVQRACARSLAMVFEDVDPDAPPAATLHGIGRRMLAMLLSEPALVIHRMVVAEADKFPELAQGFYAAGPARAIAHLSAYLGHATATGRLQVADTVFASEQFFALIQARWCMKRQLRLTCMPSEEQIEHVVGSAVRVFLAGYGV